MRKSAICFFFFLMAHPCVGTGPCGNKKNSPANNEGVLTGSFTAILRCTAAWEVWWTSRPHAPPRHIDPRHVTKECSPPFVLTSTALMELRANFAYYRMIISLALFTSPILLRSSSPKQDLAGSSLSLLHLLNHFKRYWSLFFFFFFSPKAGTQI